MGLFFDLYQALMKSLLGESAQEKEFRHAMDEAKKMYDLGWQYGKVDDLSAAAVLAERLKDKNAPEPNAIFQKYRLLSMIYIKQTALALKGYKAEMKSHLDQAESLSSYDVKDLESEHAGLQDKIQGVRAELDSMFTMPQSRKHDVEIAAKEKELEDLQSHDEDLAGKMESFYRLDTKVMKISDGLNSDIENYAEKLLTYFSAAKEVHDLSSEEKVRRDLLLKANWDEFKKIQEELQQVKAEHAEILGDGESSAESSESPEAPADATQPIESE